MSFTWGAPTSGSFDKLLAGELGIYAETFACFNISLPLIEVLWIGGLRT